VRAHGAVRARGAGDGVHGRRDAPRGGGGGCGSGGRRGARWAGVTVEALQVTRMAGLRADGCPAQ